MVFFSKSTGYVDAFDFNPEDQNPGPIVTIGRTDNYLDVPSAGFTGIQGTALQVLQDK